MTAPASIGRLLEEALIGRAQIVTLVLPWGKRSIQLRLPPDVAAFLRDELIAALGEPRQRPRRPVRLKRGCWLEINRRTPR